MGACIGSRGSRIQNVVNELKNEKIDVIRWSVDPIDFISNSLSPARITTVALYDDPAGRRAEVIVPDDQLSLAIGKNGQNVRLAAKLTEWKIDIRSETQIKGQPFGIGATTTVTLEPKEDKAKTSEGKENQETTTNQTKVQEETNGAGSENTATEEVKEVIEEEKPKKKSSRKKEEVAVQTDEEKVKEEILPTNE